MKNKKTKTWFERDQMIQNIKTWFAKNELMCENDDEVSAIINDISFYPNMTIKDVARKDLENDTDIPIFLLDYIDYEKMARHMEHAGYVYVPEYGTFYYI